MHDCVWGIELWANANKAPGSDIAIYHNTMTGMQAYGIPHPHAGKGVFVCAYNDLSWIMMKNNIIYDAENDEGLWASYDGASITSCTINNNLIGDSNLGFRWVFLRNTYTNMPALNARSDHEGNISGNPLFRNAANGDYRLLKQSSPCVNAGSFLTRIQSKSGNVLTLVEPHSAYQFSPSWGISGKKNDTIYDDDGSSTTVTAINSHNRITVANAANFIAGDSITTQKYTGAAPDIGRYEFP